MKNNLENDLTNWVAWMWRKGLALNEDAIREYSWKLKEKVEK